VCRPAAILDIQLVHQPVEIAAWSPFPPGGAECTFLGVTRPEQHEHHGELQALDYEAHESMAVDEMKRLADQAVQQWTLLAVRMHHALGRVPTGQASVVIQVVSGHRPESFEACRWLIDELKRQVPIWKRECWNTGTSWSEGTPLTTGQTGDER